MGLPDGWNKYNRVGKQVHGTRFIAFKVPLKEGMNLTQGVPEEKQLYPKLLVSLVPQLGLIIDLTNTTKYYNPDEFIQLGVRYQKIQVQGQKVPSYNCSEQFRRTVNAFLEENKDNDKLIGVHCTHGLNRSGFLVCRYMIEEMKIPALDAIAAFEIARGHKMERENYLDKLKQLRANGEGKHKLSYASQSEPSLAIDTDFDKGTQTNNGFWINESLIPAYRRSIVTATDSHTSDQIRKQVNLIGCVNAKRKDLIPDGRGGYFLHVTRKDIQRNEPTIPPNWGPNGLLDAKRPPPPMHFNESFGQRSFFPSGPHVKPPRDRYNSRFSNRSNDMMLGNMGNSLPLGSNNLSADLLKMQHNVPVPNINKRGNRPNHYY